MCSCPVQKSHHRTRKYLCTAVTNFCSTLLVTIRIPLYNGRHLVSITKMAKADNQPPPRMPLLQHWLNFLLMCVVMLPSVAILFAFNGCFKDTSYGPTHDALCEKVVNHQSWLSDPFVLINALFFLNVCILFWLINLVQGSTWLIDPYWTFLPPLMCAGFLYIRKAIFPSSEGLAGNVVHETTAGYLFDEYEALGLVLIVIWSVRLTHSYFRREEWWCGWREDWRFSDMRTNWGPWLWSVASFPVAYISQQFMLVGLCLPYYALFVLRGVSLLTFASEKPVRGGVLTSYFTQGDATTGLLDFSEMPPQKEPMHVTALFCAAGCLVSILAAYSADTQLFEYMKWKSATQAPPAPQTNASLQEKEQYFKYHILRSGLWSFSRHPNHVFEQSFWWSLCLFACSVTAWQHPWILIGPLFNSICMIQVSFLVEQRMRRNKARDALFDLYAAVTPFWVGVPCSKKDFPSLLNKAVFSTKGD